MAELLVKAEKTWMEKISLADWDKHQLTQEKYDARGEVGDIVEVRQDGSLYGNLECPPKFVVIKIPDLNFEKARSVLQNALQTIEIRNILGIDREIPKMVKKRKFRVPATLVDTALTQGGILTLTKAQIAGYIRKRSLDNNVIVENSITAQEFI